MKQTLILVAMVLLAFGCGNKSSTTNATTTDATQAMSSKPETSDKLDYPYTLDEPYQDWQPGDQKHAVNVMKSLKAFENGDIATCVEGFGDTIDLRFDYYHAKVSKDSLKKIFTTSRNDLSSIKIKMDDWESVISKDKKVEYVTMWYKETTTDKKGKTDSMSVVDDARIVNGKIVQLDEKIQHLPAKKS